MKIQLYTTSYCSFCLQAKSFLKRKGLEYEEINLDGQDELRARLSRENKGYRTVPMIFIDGEFIGGYQELIQKV